MLRPERLTRRLSGQGPQDMAIDYRLLGPLAVERDGVPVDLGAYRQRALLGLLLANAGTVLSTDRILDELWGETAGTDKQGSLWVYVSGLRGALEPGRTKRSEGAILLTRAPGYVLAVDRTTPTSDASNAPSPRPGC
jgi:DNA-binding SARP family transcriptional activator